TLSKLFIKANVDLLDDLVQMELRVRVPAFERPACIESTHSRGWRKALASDHDALHLTKRGHLAEKTSELHLELHRLHGFVETSCAEVALVEKRRHKRVAPLAHHRQSAPGRTERRARARSRNQDIVKIALW